VGELTDPTRVAWCLLTSEKSVIAVIAVMEFSNLQVRNLSIEAAEKLENGDFAGRFAIHQAQ
jgi:hypothetical protein